MPQGGGPGIILRDADVAETSDGPHDAATEGPKDATDAKRDVAAESAAGGSGGFPGAGTGGTGAGTGGGTGGAAGGTDAGAETAPPLDPCRACEQRRCTKPQNDFESVDIAYDLCFVDIDVPPILQPTCGGDQLASRLTTGGANPGTAKSVLCHAILDCVAKTKCSGGFGVDDFQTCYCGAGVTSAACQAVDFIPKGACSDVIAAGAESTSNPAITMGFNAACLASGAAFYAFGCYENCCSKECLGVDTPSGADDSYCNEPLPSSGTGGAGGSAGQAAGAAGGTGGGGTAGAGGDGAVGGSSGGAGGAAAGTGGNGTAGAAGTHGGGSGAGGAAGSGPAGAGGAAGSSAAGSGGAAGSSGAAGSGAGGAAGSSTAGAGGGAPPPGTDQFNGSTASWMPSFGATVGYSTSDADGSISSGSLDLTVANGDASAVWIVAATRCISAVPGATYDLSGKIFIPTSASGDLAGLGLWYYASTDCSGGAGGTFTAPQEAVVGVWQSMMASAQVPAGMQSMSVHLVLTKPYGKTTAEALFDDVLVTKH